MGTTWQLVMGYLRYRPLAATLSIGLLALGVGLLSLLVLLDQQLTRQFERNLAGIDLVIGAKGSPLQLVTSSIYHADAPTGNVPIAEVKAFGNPKHPLIEEAIPLALGDSYRGRRIVGTTQSFLGLYDASIAQGKTFDTPFEVVLGANAARKLALNLGDEFKSVHGLDDNPDLVHADGKSFSVSGILEPTGLVIDELIITQLQTVWDVHGSHDHGEEDAHDHDDHEGHDHDNHTGHDHADEHNVPTSEPRTLNPAPAAWYTKTDQDITVLLAKFKGRNTMTLNFARNLNANTNLMAATPAVVMAQFSEQVSSAEDVIQALAIVIVLASMLSLLIILLNALRERKGDLSLLRALGATPSFIFGMVLLESVVLAILGSLAGLVLGRIGLWILNQQLADKYPVGQGAFALQTVEGYAVLGAIGLALIAALYPAWRAYRVDPGL
jgi:putative ABC transport system permease protein